MLGSNLYIFKNYSGCCEENERKGSTWKWKERRDSDGLEESAVSGDAEKLKKLRTLNARVMEKEGSTSTSGLPFGHRGGWRCHLLAWEY